MTLPVFWPASARSRHRPGGSMRPLPGSGAELSWSKLMSQTLSPLRPLADHRPLRPITGATRIGHVHLKVADLERALSFYCGVLGFEVTQRREGAVFISAGGYHHHIALNTWESLGGAPPAPGSTGLYHLAILYPTRRDLADA